MADESLRLRDPAGDPGLRATSGEGALRNVPGDVAQSLDSTSRLSALVTGYNSETAKWEVTVGWRIKSLPTVSVPASGAVSIREVRVMYSWTGYPEFWNDGDTTDVNWVADSGGDTQTLARKPDDPSTLGGLTTIGQLSNWLYLSLFTENMDSSSNVYRERVAVVSVLIPTYHNLSASMMNRVPSYYRSLDTTGHLEKFLAVFGWEADQNRTLIEEIMHLKDAQRVHYDSLDRLGSTFGSLFTTQELRPHQIRALLTDSQTYNSQRGRADTLLRLLSIITDSDVSYRQFKTTGASTAAPYDRIKFVTAARRLNLIKDPRFNGAPGASATWNHLTSASAGSITVAGTGAGTNGVTLSTNGSGAGTAYIFPGDAVQIKRAIPYFAGIAATLTNATAQVRLYREKPTSAGSLPDEAKYYSNDAVSGSNYYKTLSLSSAGDTYLTTAFVERSGFDLGSGAAEANAVYITGSTNGVLFRARLYSSTNIQLSDCSLKLTRVDLNPSSGSRFDRFDLAVNDGSSDVLTANNLTVNTAGQLIDEDDSSVVTKLTNTTGGVTYTLLVDNVPTIAYATTTELPSDDTSTYPFINTGVEELYPVIVITLANGATVSLDKWIFQPFANEAYFDGSTLDGHSYISGSSVVSDHYWSGTVNNSVSLYTPFRYKNKAAIRKMIVNNIPLTISTELTSSNYHTTAGHGHLVTFDSKPGDERAFDPHSWTANVYTEGIISSISG
jgi:hypothetical protein